MTESQPTVARPINAHVTVLEPLTPMLWRLVCVPDEDVDLAFAAGQYASVTFADSNERPIQRFYSIATPPSRYVARRELEFHISLASGGPVSVLLRTGRLVPGDLVQVSAPHGTAYWRSDFSGPTLLIAGGSGLAPMLAIAETAIEQDAGHSIDLYIGMRDEVDVYAEAELRGLAQRAPYFRYQFVLSEPVAKTGRRIGLVTDVLAADRPAFVGYQAYASGSSAMIEASAVLLLTRGLREADFHADGYAAVAEQARLRAQTLSAG